MAPSQESNSKNSDNTDEIDADVRSDRRYTDKRWTLGNSQELVEGQEKEAPLVTAAWIVIPIVAALLILILMTR